MVVEAKKSVLEPEASSFPASRFMLDDDDDEEKEGGTLDTKAIPGNAVPSGRCNDPLHSNLGLKGVDEDLGDAPGRAVMSGEVFQPASLPPVSMSFSRCAVLERRWKSCSRI